MGTTSTRHVRTVLVLAAAAALAGCAVHAGAGPSQPKSAPVNAQPGGAPSSAPSPAVPAVVPATVAAKPSSSPTVKPTSPPAPATPASVHFATPQDAMRYLALEYNADNFVALRAVTTPASRAALLAMRSEAVNLRLNSCARNPAGDYTCTFRHDYPASLHLTGHGHSTFLVAPASRPGWYMTVLAECG